MRDQRVSWEVKGFDLFDKEMEVIGEGWDLAWIVKSEWMGCFEMWKFGM